MWAGQKFELGLTPFDEDFGLTIDILLTFIQDISEKQNDNCLIRSELSLEILF